MAILSIMASDLEPCHQTDTTQRQPTTLACFLYAAAHCSNQMEDNVHHLSDKFNSLLFNDALNGQDYAAVVIG